MNIREQVRRGMTQVDGLSLRERGMLMIGAFMVMFLVWDWLLMADLTNQSDALNTEIVAARDRMERLSGSLAAVAQNRGTDPNEMLQEQLAQTRERIDELDQMLAARASHVIPPREMAGVLEEVLRRQGRLTLVAARTLPAEALFQPDEKADIDVPASVYRHGLELEVNGRYLDVLEYLRTLESLKPRFFWDTVTLESVDYPSNRVRIRVYSLNLEEGWLGV